MKDQLPDTILCHGSCGKRKFPGGFSDTEKRKDEPICKQCRSGKKSGMKNLLSQTRIHTEGRADW